MGVTISRYGRFWAVYEGREMETEGDRGNDRGKEDLVCLCVYRKGAVEVSRRLGVPHPTLPQRTKTKVVPCATERSDEDGLSRNDFAYGRRSVCVGKSGSNG